MNVFEDLIGELKDENLLEETVMDGQWAGDRSDAADTSSEDVTVEEPANAQLLEDGAEGEASSDYNVEVINEPEENPNASNAQEFYRKRAVDEVSGLQMVDHVLSGVERELMKVVPKSFDDLQVKKSLHSFLQASSDTESLDHAKFEFQLMQETENWCSALAHRDGDISAADLRRFCENSKPALSSQALIALAKFYRNLPHSEAVRNKFDFVVTRLFSKEIAEEKRYLVFGREEMIAHFKTLYADWSSISLYSSSEDNSDILVAALRFEDFMAEADAAEHFDDLIRTEFFDRLRHYKESANEIFYAPTITAAAVECNVRIGNRVVDLLRVVRDTPTTEDLYEKYGIHDQAVSDATSRTTELVDLLRERHDEIEAETEDYEEEFYQEAPEKAPEVKKKAAAAPRGKFTDNLFAVNKWLLTAWVVVLLLSVGVYVWSERFAGEETAVTTAGVVNFDLENSTLKEHIKVGRVSNEVFYGITLPSFDILTKEKKEEFVQKVLAAGNENVYNKVQLSDPKGTIVAVASTQPTAHTANNNSQ
jgi:hypothetical protein